MSARQIVGACMLGAYLLVLGFLGGMIVSAIRFDGRRAAVLSKFDDAMTRDDAIFLVVRHESTLGRRNRIRLLTRLP